MEEHLADSQSHFGWMVRRVLEHEGGYVNDPKDPGGETNFGISKRSYPDVDIKNLTEKGAIEIYFKDYWKDYMDLIKNSTVCLMLFDIGVNAGINRSVKLLQKSLRVAEDGAFGPVTLSAVNTSHNGTIVKKFLENVILFYSDLPGFKYYKKAWIRRAIDNACWDRG